MLRLPSRFTSKPRWLNQDSDMTMAARVSDTRRGGSSYGPPSIAVPCPIIRHHFAKRQRPDWLWDGVPLELVHPVPHLRLPHHGTIPRDHPVEGLLPKRSGDLVPVRRVSTRRQSVTLRRTSSAVVVTLTRSVPAVNVTTTGVLSPKRFHQCRLVGSKSVLHWQVSDIDEIAKPAKEDQIFIRTNRPRKPQGANAMQITSGTVSSSGVRMSKPFRSKNKMATPP